MLPNETTDRRDRAELAHIRRSMTELRRIQTTWTACARCRDRKATCLRGGAPMCRPCASIDPAIAIAHRRARQRLAEVS